MPGIVPAPPDTLRADMLPTPIPRRIGVSLGTLGNLQDGLGEVSLQRGRRLAAAAPGWHQAWGVSFDFHLRPSLEGLFGDGVGYLGVSRWQRLHHRQPHRYGLWHSLHQLNKNLPPAGTLTRLVTVHDLNYLYAKGAFSRWRDGRRMRRLAARTDHIVAISRYTADDVVRHLGWRGPLEVIHNGARNLVGEPREPLAAAAADGRPFLFHLSRMSDSKNPQAILRLAQAWPQMHFLMCGPPSKEARRLAADNRLPNVEFHLGISDPQKAWAYAHCAGFLFPSLTEGFGLPPIEAMHFGKPVFLARRTCLPEIGGDAAWYFDEFDPSAMRAVVERGLQEATGPGRSQAIRDHAGRFDWDRCAQAYLRLYAALLGLPVPAGAGAPAQG